MANHLFKTNIHCNSCIAKVSPALNKSLEIEHWEVDTESDEKILTVETSLTAREIETIIQTLGYQCEEIIK
ncbi:MAG: cation transporter [Bacteroidales bacterium]|jgi:copper chaperone CopZ|nr:cation transporter [Bacteroidales bacterium]